MSDPTITSLLAEREELRRELEESRADRVTLARLLDEAKAKAERPLDNVMRTSCGHEWTVRHTACPTCFVDLRSRLSAALAERDRYKAVLELVMRVAPVYCEHLEHEVSERHWLGTPCPVEAKIAALARPEEE